MENTFSKSIEIDSNQVYHFGFPQLHRAPLIESTESKSSNMLARLLISSDIHLTGRRKQNENSTAFVVYFLIILLFRWNFLSKIN